MLKYLASKISSTPKRTATAMLPTPPSPLFDWHSPLLWIALLSSGFIVLLLALVLGASPLLPLALLFGLTSLILLFRAPLILLSLLFVVRMSLDYSSQYWTISLFDITLTLSQLLGLSIASLGILCILLNIPALLRFPLLIPFLTVSLWGLATLLYSISPSATSYELLRFFNLFIIGLLAFVSIKRHRDFRTLLQAIFLSSLLPILFGLYQFVMGIGLQDENVSIPRIFGTFSHPNVYSLFLFALVALSIVYVIIYAKTRAARLLSASYIILLMVTLVLTYARIAWIALFIFLGLLTLWRAKILILPLVLIPLVLITFSLPIRDRVTEIFHPTPDSSITWRQNLWHDMILKTDYDNREFLGSGMDTFRISSEALRGIRFGSNDPHNDFVKFYVEGGIIGILVLSVYTASFMFLVARIALTTPSHSLRTLATITGFVIITLLLAGLSDNVFKNTPVQWILWSLMGGLLALQRESTKKSLPA